MKKNIIFLLSSFIILSLCGCGKTNEINNTNNLSTEAVETEKDIIEESSDLNVAADEMYSEDIVVELERDNYISPSEKLETGDGPLIYGRLNTFYKSTDDIKRLYTNSQEFLYVVQDSYPGIKKALDDYNSKIDCSGMVIDHEILNIALDASTTFRKDGVNYTGFYDKGTSYISRLDDKILSIKYISESFYGDKKAVGVSGYVYDVNSGDKIEIINVVSDIDSLKFAANEIFNRDYVGIIQDYPESIDKLVHTFDDISSINWNMGPTSLDLFYNKSQLTADNTEDEVQVISIRFSDYPDLFNKGYGAVEGDWIQCFDEASGDVHMEDISNDGVIDFICAKMSYDTDNPYEYGNSIGIDIETVEDKKHFDFFNYGSQTYLVKKSNRFFIYVFLGVGDVGDSVRVFEITNGNIVESQNMGYSMSLPESLFAKKSEEKIDNFYSQSKSLFYDDDFFYTTNVTYLLDMLSAYAACGLREDGSIVPIKGYYEFSFDMEYTSKIDLNLNEVDENGNVTDSTTVPAGNKFILYRTDDTSYADFKLEDGKIVRVMIDSSVSPHTVDGTSFYEVFEY